MHLQSGAFTFAVGIFKKHHVPTQNQHSAWSACIGVDLGRCVSAVARCVRKAMQIARGENARP